MYVLKKIISKFRWHFISVWSLTHDNVSLLVVTYQGPGNIINIDTVFLNLMDLCYTSNTRHTGPECIKAVTGALDILFSS